MFKKTLITITLSLLAVGSSMAVGLTIANHSFEDPVTTETGTGAWADPVTEWTDSQASHGFVENAVAIGVTGQDGLNWAGMDATPVTILGGNAYSGIIHQDLFVPWAANSKYTLTITQGLRASSGTGSLVLGLYSGTLETDEVNEGSMTWSDADITDLSSETRTFNFNTGAVAPAGNVKIFIAKEGAKVYFDNVSLDVTVVPEPSSSALLGLAGACLILRRRR